jgi:hypothetical protein
MKQQKLEHTVAVFSPEIGGPQNQLTSETILKVYYLE